ncbi:MAG: hypothetical protein NZ920_01240 [Aigarchaeota archaeon]|nr:hypothetical protein [Aigarchaeota archaeon]MDW8093065.1 hypothetical protein [Nitrososphaerota archaeon]
MKVKLDQHEYTVILRASAWPHLSTLARAFSDNPPDPQALERAEEEVLKTCVRPQPCEEHANQILTKILLEFVREMRYVTATFRGELVDSVQ